MFHLYRIIADTDPQIMTAQYVAPVQNVVTGGPIVFPYNFFIALVAGVVLAIAFELILTNLSVAAGLNVLGGFTRPSRGKAGEHGGGAAGGEGVIEKVRGITSIVGIWTLITASIALFFSSWLAVELSLTGSLLVGQ
jgi:hypothetical protein